MLDKEEKLFIESKFQLGQAVCNHLCNHTIEILDKPGSLILLYNVFLKMY